MIEKGGGGGGQLGLSNGKCEKRRISHHLHQPLRELPLVPFPLPYCLYSMVYTIIIISIIMAYIAFLLFSICIFLCLCHISRYSQESESVVVCQFYVMLLLASLVKHRQAAKTTDNMQMSWASYRLCSHSNLLTWAPKWKPRCSAAAMQHRKCCLAITC